MILLEKVRKSLQEWVDKQGHERCWYYPDIFRRLCELLDIKATVPPQLPSRSDFDYCCKRFADEEYSTRDGLSALLGEMQVKYKSHSNIQVTDNGILVKDLLKVTDAEADDISKIGAMIIRRRYETR